MAPAAGRAVHPVDAQTFREAMSQLAAPLAIVTALDEAGRWWGFTASSVTSASLDPPMLLVGLARTSSCHAALTGAREFAVNVLGGQHAGIARRFASRGVDRFAGTGFVDWPGSGVPWLPDAIAVFRCAVVDVLRAGDHDLLLGAMEDTRINVAGRPLLWYRREFHLPLSLLGSG